MSRGKKIKKRSTRERLIREMEKDYDPGAPGEVKISYDAVIFKFGDVLHYLEDLCEEPLEACMVSLTLSAFFEESARRLGGDVSQQMGRYKRYIRDDFKEFLREQEAEHAACR